MLPMKKNVLLFSLIILGVSLSSCSKENNAVSFDDALAILKKIDRQINYTPITNIPHSYILKEELSSYTDEGKELKDVTIDREINQDDYYSFVRIKGTYNKNVYIRENWTYVTDKKNVACNYVNYQEDGKLISKRYREESERSLENWTSFAQNDITEKQRLYAQMAKKFYTYLSSMEGEINDICSSSSEGSVNVSASNSKEKYTCEFQDYWFVFGKQENLTDSTFYSATVSWNKCDISLPNLNFYPLISEE